MFYRGPLRGMEVHSAVFRFESSRDERGLDRPAPLVNAARRSILETAARARVWTLCERGVTAVEFAFVILPLCAFLVAIIQIGVVFLAQNELETAVEKAARSLLIGSAQQSGVTRDQFVSSVCANLPALFTCSGVMVDLQTVDSFASADTSAPTLTYNSSGEVANKWRFAMGGAEAIMALRVFYQFPVTNGPLRFNLANLPNGRRLLSAVAVFQVEPYSTLGP